MSKEHNEAMDQKMVDAMLNAPHVSKVNSDAITAVAAAGPGSVIYFKWTCSSCGERATANQPNSLYTRFRHDDCGDTTSAIDGDLGFMLVIGVNQERFMEDRK